MLNISIPNPCYENWNEMMPTEKGAFCNVCSKEVVDFSQMSDEEVKHYFLANAGKNTCGRFRKKQLAGFPVVVDEQVVYMNIALWKKFLAVVVICFGMFFSSCSEKKEQEDIQDFGITPVSSPASNDTSTKPEPVQPGKNITYTVGFTPAIFIKNHDMSSKPEIAICDSVMGDPITNDEFTGGVPMILPEEPKMNETLPLPPKDSVVQPVDTCSGPFIL